MSETVEIIAEAGVNHDGSVDVAHELVERARAAGADVVKFQAFRTADLVSGRAAKADYQRRTSGADESQASMLARLELDARAFADLADHARRIGIEFLSTPFDEESLRMLVALGVGRIKLGSGDLTNSFLLRAAAETKLPLILSTGMATLGEIEDALGVVAAAYAGVDAKDATRAELLDDPATRALLEARVTLLHCTTEYPAPVEQTNLRAIATMRAAFGLPVGYSDHTDGIAVSLAAVALGAHVIEKHFTLDRTRSGPDHAASLDPSGLADLVRGVRVVAAALGTAVKRPGAAERRNISAARRSLVAAARIPAGAVIERTMLTAKRPGGGVSPMRVDEVVGRVARRDYERDDLIVVE